MEDGPGVDLLFDAVELTVTLACRRCGTQALEADLAQEALNRWLGSFMTVHATCHHAPG